MKQTITPAKFVWQEIHAFFDLSVSNATRWSETCVMISKEIYPLITMTAADAFYGTLRYAWFTILTIRNTTLTEYLVIWIPVAAKYWSRVTGVAARSHPEHQKSIKIFLKRSSFTAEMRTATRMPSVRCGPVVQVIEVKTDEWNDHVLLSCRHVPREQISFTIQFQMPFATYC